MAKTSQARKSSSVPTKVYTYGASRISSDHLKIIHDQIWFGHKYQNKLIEIERTRRASIRSLFESISPEIKENYNTIDSMDAVIKEKYTQLNSLKKDRDSDPIALEIKSLKNNIKDIRQINAKLREKINNEYFKEENVKFHLKLLKMKLEYLSSTNIEAQNYLNDLTANSENAISAANAFLKASKFGPRVSERLSNLLNEQISTENWNEKWLLKNSIERKALADIKAARENNNCCTGVGAAIDKAVEKSIADSKFEPRFVKFDKTGLVGSQIRNNLSVKDALAGRDSWLKIDLLPDVRIKGKGRDERVAAIARMKLSGTDKNPVFVDIPFVMHRALPDDGIIKWVYLNVKRIGNQIRYEIQFTLESESFVSAIPATDDNVSVDLGWRIQANGDIKVATIWDSKKENSLILPVKFFNNRKYVKKLISYSDNYFNEVKSNLISFSKETEFSDDLKEEIKNISHWKSHAKLHKFVHMFAGKFDSILKEIWKTWKDERLSAKLDLFDSIDNIFVWCNQKEITDNSIKMAIYLKWWSYKDDHLITMARNIERKNTLHRREIYRCMAAKLANTYTNVVISKTNYSKIAKNPKPENDDRTRQEENSGINRQACGISVFTEALKLAFGKNRTKEISIKNISDIHYGCGGKVISTMHHEMVQCSKCQRSFNQDVNAAVHLLEQVA